MSEDNIEINIVRAEGLQVCSQSIGCFVQIDGRLHDVITPLNSDNQENEVNLPKTGLLRLIVKNMSNAAEVIGSVSFDLKILPTEGFQWLPIFNSTAKDQIFIMPEEVDKGKILILINPDKKDSSQPSPPQTLNQKASILNNLQDCLHKEKSYHQLEVSKLEKQYKGFIDTLSTENEKHKQINNKYYLLFEDLTKELKSTKLLLSEEHKLRIEMQEKISKVTQEYEENLKRAKIREDTLLRMLEKKDDELNDSTTQITHLKTALRNLDYEKQQIVDIVDDYKKELAQSNMMRLNKELTLVKNLLEESETQRHKLQQYIQELPDTPSKLNSFMSPISLGSTIVVECSDDALEGKQMDIMLNEFMKKYDKSAKNLGDKNIVKVEKVEKVFNESAKIEVGNVKNHNRVGSMQEISTCEDLALDYYKKGILAKNILSPSASASMVNGILNNKNDGYKTHRRGVTVAGLSLESDENEEIATVRGLKSPPDANFIKNKNPGSKGNFIQTATTPLRERISNKKYAKKVPFK